MACQIQIRVDGDVEYCWIGRTNKTIAPHGQLYVIGNDNTITLTEPRVLKTSKETFKVTLYSYSTDKKIFQNKGTFLFRVGVPDGSHKDIGYTLDTKSVSLLPPSQKNERWDHGIETPFFKVNITVCLPFFVEDVYDEYKKLSEDIQRLSSRIEESLYSTTQIKGCDNCEWFVRQSQNEYEWPFCMPGCTGIRQAGYGIPTLCMINALVEHACLLCGFSYDVFKTMSPHSKEYTNILLALSCIAMGASGYSNGYSTEVSVVYSTSISNYVFNVYCCLYRILMTLPTYG